MIANTVLFVFGRRSFDFQCGEESISCVGATNRKLCSFFSSEFGFGIMGMVFLGSMIVVIVIFMVEILIVHYNYQYHYHVPSYYLALFASFSQSFYLVVVVVSWWLTVLGGCGSGDGMALQRRPWPQEP